VHAALRSLLAIVAGFLTANVANIAGSILNGALFPALASAVVQNDPAALARAIETTPGAGAAFAIVLVAWVLGSFAGGYVAARIAARAPLAHALVVGALFMAGGVVNNLAFPPPVWFWAATFVVFLPPAWLGGRIAAREPGAG